jgi:hypothetical protein
LVHDTLCHHDFRRNGAKRSQSRKRIVTEREARQKRFSTTDHTDSHGYEADWPLSLA